MTELRSEGRGVVAAARQPVTLRVVGARAAPRGGRMPHAPTPVYKSSLMSRSMATA